MRGDREVSGSGVCKGVGEAPTFTEWSMMMVPTYPEDDSRALKVYQHQHHGCAGRAQGAYYVVRDEGTITLSRDCVDRFGWNLHAVRQRAARSILP